MHPSEIHSKRILISPLNWGGGHVARCIPLIDLLIRNNNTVYFAGDPDQIHIVRQYFSNILFLEFQGYPFDFKGSGSFRKELISVFLKLTKRMISEINEVERLCKSHSIDVVIADHRYGFRSKKVKSVFLTHQVNLPTLWYECFLNRIHYRLMRKFDEVWIADDEKGKFAGKLSDLTHKLNAHYIGTLSRFSLYAPLGIEKDGSVIIVSGPLAYARKFALEQLHVCSNEDVIMILPDKLKGISVPSNIRLVISDDWRACDEIILKAGKIVSRSGYSTLMDLIQLKVPFSISPTPGQTEQKYLFNYWTKRIIPSEFRIDE